MKTRADVTPEKLRGGFYTPAPMVAVCLARIRERLSTGPLRILEPSVGDGAFVRALAAPEWHDRVADFRGIEPLEIEAEKSRQALSLARLSGTILGTSAICWGAETDEGFDAAVGNPPFVRYQFISADDRAATAQLGARLGLHFAGVSNLWIPVLLAALARLREGGAFAFVVPTECFTGCSAAVVRSWLIGACEEIQFDLFAVGSFPGVLQEVAILSGRRGRNRGALPVRVVEHLAHGDVEWTYDVADAAPWTRYLLDPSHLEALDVAGRLPLATNLRKLVAFEVSIVTGANDYFSVDDDVLSRYGLEPWAVPLLPRARHAPGLVLTDDDWRVARAAGVKVWLLDFGSERPDPLRSKRVRDYIALGEELALHERYKCRIRDPWYRVPGIVRGELLLSKRCHDWPRVIVNDAASFTTDTIYRGRIVSDARTARDIAAAFHNSLTLLSAELEGRSFGGGVLELVPSEIGRLVTLVPEDASTWLPRLDAVARAGPPEALVEATDELLIGCGALPADLVPLLREGREILASRRFDRNRGGEAAQTAVAMAEAA